MRALPGPEPTAGPARREVHLLHADRERPGATSPVPRYQIDPDQPAAGDTGHRGSCRRVAEHPRTHPGRSNTPPDDRAERPHAGKFHEGRHKGDIFTAATRITPSKHR